MMLCPEPRCAKVGLSQGAECPDHGVRMERTVVMTEAYVRGSGTFGKMLDGFEKHSTRHVGRAE